MGDPKVNIRQLQPSEIPSLAGFSPPEWSFDLAQFLARHLGQVYFYAVVAELESQIVGCGNGMINGSVGWLGNIIVHPAYRRRGIGTEITRHLMEYFNAKGCRSQLLISTQMGEGLYRKLGFSTSSTYMFYRGDRVLPAKPADEIRRIRPEDAPFLCEIDQEITGEDRKEFIPQFFKTGWIYESSPRQIEGFYLPEFGNGLILARSEAAGSALLKFKLSQGSTTVVIPSANTVAQAVLTAAGFSAIQTVPRMVCGKEANWTPERVFSRASGYCG